MQIDFKNGTTVSRIWGDLTDGELLAAFQYDCDALLFADVAAHRLDERAYFIVTDHHSGKVTVVRKPAPITTEQKAA